MSCVVTWMFHQIHQPGTDRLARFARFLDQLMKTGPCVLPGAPLPARSSSAFCLTFDDAYVDFAHHVAPLLKERGLGAILGVPAGYIQEDAPLALEERLAVPYPQGLEAPYVHQKVPLCTWKELRALRDDMPDLHFAAHGWRHESCATSDPLVLHEALVRSKNTLEAQLNRKVDTFIYPYGACTRFSDQQASLIYPYRFRIGAASNKALEGLCYRVDADLYWPNNQMPSKLEKVRWQCSRMWNRARRR